MQSLVSQGFTFCLILLVSLAPALEGKKKAVTLQATGLPASLKISKGTVNSAIVMSKLLDGPLAKAKEIPAIQNQNVSDFLDSRLSKMAKALEATNNGLVGEGVRQESKQRSNWLVSAEISSGFVTSTYAESSQYQAIISFQAQVAYDFTNHQCFKKERRNSVFCTEALLEIQAGAGYLTESQIPFFRFTGGFEFDFYLGRQRTVALTLKWRFGYGWYAIKSDTDQEGVIAENFRVSGTTNKDRIEWGIGPGLLIQLGSLSPKAEGVSIYVDSHFISPLDFGFVLSLGVQYRF